MRAGVPLALIVLLGTSGTTRAQPIGTQETSPLFWIPWARTSALPWIQEDPLGALRSAADHGVPIVVEFWAPSSDASSYMHELVFGSPEFLALSARGNWPQHFVWVSTDTDKPKQKNDAFWNAFPSDVSPTYYVLTPDGKTLLGVWRGPASSSEFQTLLADAAAAFGRWKLQQSGLSSPENAYSLIVDGHRAALGGDPRRATELFNKALALSQDKNARFRTELLLAQVNALLQAKDHEGCVELATAELAHTGSHRATCDVAATALRCAQALPSTDAAHRTALAQAIADRLTRFVVELKGLAADETPSAFDLSEGWRVLGAANRLQGDEEGVRAAAAGRLAIVEHATRTATSPAFTLPYAKAHAEALLDLRRGEEAVRFLTALEKQLPDDATPPRLLGATYLALGQTALAHAALERAQAKQTARAHSR